MRRRHVLVYLITAAGVPVTLNGCGRKIPILPRLDAGAVVLAFGDSLTYGTGARPEESYPAVLEKLITRRVVRSGVPGETTEGALKRLPEVLDDAEPQLLVLCSGGNDLLQRLEEPETIANLRAMIKLAKERGISVLLLAPPRPVVLTAAPEYYAALGTEFGIPVETEVLARVLADKSLKSDLVHPNAKGYAEVAAALAKLLKGAKAL